MLKPIYKLTAFFGISFMVIFLVSLTLESWSHTPSCTLCKVERFFFLGAAFLAGMAYCSKEKVLKFFMKVLAFVWFIGSGVALYHTAIQYHWVALPSFCTIQEPEGDTLEEIASNLLNLKPVPCDKVTQSFLGLPTPFYLTFLMFFLGILCWNIEKVLWFRFKAR